MSGGGGGGPFRRRGPEELARLVRRAEETTYDAAFEAELSSLLAEFLGGYNSRDVELVRQRLDDLRDALEGCVDGTLDQLFGGSVAKHTYVDGLSDIDSLFIVNSTDLETGGPRAALRFMKDVMKRQLGDQAQVSHGRIAVTVQYPDGMAIQILPAIKTADGKLRVPSSRRDGWSRIDPDGFRTALTRRNEECAGKLVPTIKLAKAIIGSLPEEQRLSGYHVESLAVAVFRNYDGKKTTAAMLPTFFERAKHLVRGPIRDSTGQSVHVDEYLGPADSQARLTASQVLGRLAKRIRNATLGRSIGQWRALFDSGE